MSSRERVVVFHCLPSCHLGDQPWALVTGASDGIGKGQVSLSLCHFTTEPWTKYRSSSSFDRIAEELLARGCNVILHGRNYNKLRSVQKYFEGLYPDIQTALFVYDASHLDISGTGAPSLHAAVASILKGRRLTILVNNVGYTSSYEKVWEHDPQAMDTIVDVGIRFITHLTRAVLPHLLAPSNTPSLIINVTGLTARYPSPLLAIHSGAKAYIEAFSRALSIELNLVEPRQDVECIAVDVHNVASNSNSSKPSFFTYVCIYPIWSI